MVFNSQHLNSAELSMIILNISLQFLAVLSIHYDIPRMTLINFSRPLNVYVKLLPIDLTLVQILISCSTLTEFEINDFEMNPALFLDYAYCPVPNKKNIRRFCADLSIYLTSLNERFLQILLNQQPSESSMYLMAMIIKPNIPGDYNQQIYNWVISCTQISQTSPIIYSTFLFLISKSYDLLTNDDKQLILQNIINLLRTNNATLFCNALKCFRKLLKEQFVVPNDIIEKIIEFTSICPTNDASKTLQILLKFYPDLTIALSSRIIDAIFSGIIIHYSQESELNEESISKSLEILSEIINEIGSNVITENVINSITFLLSNFNNLIDISDNLCTLISFIFYTNSEYNIILLRNLAQAIQQNEHIMEEMNKFYIPIIIFISAHLNEYVALNCANLFYSIGLNLISMSLKNGSIEMLNAGAELVCWNLQIDNSLDISALLQMIPLIQVDYIKFEIISSVIIFGFFDIVNNEVLNNLLHFLEIIPKCFYEKRLHTVALLKLCIINKGLSDVLIPVASELLLNEKQQRITIGNAKVNFLYCPHEFKAPVEYMDLGNFIKGALENCSDNCRETYKSAFEKCFV